MLPNYTNVRIVERIRYPYESRLVAGQWFVAPGDEKKLGKVRMELAGLRQDQPETEYWIETRGDSCDWHRADCL